VLQSGLCRANLFWEHVDPLLHNSALATRCVIPLLWLQKHRQWQVGVEDQLSVLHALVRCVEAERVCTVYWRDFSNPADMEVYCDACFNHARGRRAILFVAFRMPLERLGDFKTYCPACFVDKQERFTHFRNCIDRRYK